jgi:hypothetical protein
MLKAIRLLLGVASAIGAASPSFATPITYTEQATATGSLGGVAFTDASVLLTMHTDTTTIVETNPGLFSTSGFPTMSGYSLRETLRSRPMT